MLEPEQSSPGKADDELKTTYVFRRNSMVSKELLEILACPSCKGDLIYNAVKDTLTCKARHCSECGMPVDSAGRCTESECGRTSSRPVSLEYRVEDDIPIMLIYEAKKLPL
jgi:uncharacterized protein YbaR (Trm112 family)